MIKIKTSPYIFFCASLLTSHVLAGDIETAKPLLESQPKTQLEPNLQSGKKIYELCATCHYANGWGKEDGSFPVIAGQHPSVIKKQLADFRSKDRDNPTMFPFTDNKMLGGAQGIEDVSAYISQLPTNPIIGKGEGKQLEEGKKLFIEKCAACHGKHAEGNEEAVFPRIQGQHYDYMLRQLKWIRDGHRKNANPVMLEQVKTMDDATLAIIADYVSRIEITSKLEAQKSTTEKTDAKEEEPDCD